MVLYVGIACPYTAVHIYLGKGSWTGLRLLCLSKWYDIGWIPILENSNQVLVQLWYKQACCRWSCITSLRLSTFTFSNFCFCLRHTGALSPRWQSYRRGTPSKFASAPAVLGQVGQLFSNLTLFASNPSLFTTFPSTHILHIPSGPAVSLHRPLLWTQLWTSPCTTMAPRTASSSPPRQHYRISPQR